jgi:hypothetical protein
VRPRPNCDRSACLEYTSHPQDILEWVRQIDICKHPVRTACRQEPNPDGVPFAAVVRVTDDAHARARCLGKLGQTVVSAVGTTVEDKNGFPRVADSRAVAHEPADSVPGLADKRARVIGG